MPLFRPLHCFLLHLTIISIITATTLIDKTTCRTTDSKLMIEAVAFITFISFIMPQSYARISNHANFLHKICPDCDICQSHGAIYKKYET